MAMDVGGAKGGIKSDINVTPLVDVMLVLLIIVMLVAPLIQQGVSLTLPTANSSVPKPDTDDQTTVYVAANRRLYVNSIEVIVPELVVRLSEIVDSGNSQVVYLKGDDDAPFNIVLHMMAAFRAGMIYTVALITESIAAL